MLSIILASALISAYVGAALIAVKTLTEAPTFEPATRFDLRINYGDHVRLIASKPVVKWEEPEPYFAVHLERRVPVPLGYKVESMA